MASRPLLLRPAAKSDSRLSDDRLTCAVNALPEQREDDAPARVAPVHPFLELVRMEVVSELGCSLAVPSLLGNCRYGSAWLPQQLSIRFSTVTRATSIRS